MGPTKLTLTMAQRMRLEPLFAEVRACNVTREPCAIMAQVLPDGMIVKAVSGEALEALQKALGVDPNAPPQRSVKRH